MKHKEYIHITEAVNVYNKTRQTFYNYIKKWQIATKKINNKLYLKVDDIEKLTSDYLHISEQNNTLQGEIITPEYDTFTNTEYDHLVEEEERNNNIPLFQEKLQKDLLRLHKQYYTLKDNLIDEIKHNKQDILFDIKAMNYNQEQRIITNISQQYTEIMHYKKQLNKNLKLLLLKNKKLGFWLGYSIVMLLQLIIRSYIF